MCTGQEQISCLFKYTNSQRNRKNIGGVDPEFHYRQSFNGFESTDEKPKLKTFC